MKRPNKSAPNNAKRPSNAKRPNNAKRSTKLPPKASTPKKSAPRLHFNGRVRRLLEPFRRRGPDGRPLYSKADRKLVYELLLVTLIPPGRYGELPKRLQVMVGQLSVRSGASTAKSPRAAMRRLQAYFRKNPPNKALLAELNRVMKDLMAELEAGALASVERDSRPRGGLEGPSLPNRLGVSSGLVGFRGF